MPIYEYKCKQGHILEVLQRLADDEISACTTCGAPVKRVFHPVAVHFKGSGFYSTDYGKKGAPAPADSKGESDSAAKSSSSSESGSDSGSGSSSGSASDSGSSSDSGASKGKKNASDSAASSSSDKKKSQASSSRDS